MHMAMADEVMSLLVIFYSECAIRRVTTYAGFRHRQTSRAAAEDYRRVQA